MQDLDPGQLVDLKHAEEDVPLTENGTITRAGELYLLSEYAHICDLYAGCENYLKVFGIDGEPLDIEPFEE